MELGKSTTASCSYYSLICKKCGQLTEPKNKDDSFYEWETEQLEFLMA